MLEYISDKSASLLLSRLEGQEDNKSVYTYGFCLLYSSCFIIFSILLLSGLIEHAKYGIYFFLIFIPLRSYSGGYHSQSYTGCFFVSNACFLFTYFLAEGILAFLPCFSLLIITFFISIYIYSKSPVEHKSHPIPKELIPLYRFKTGILLTMFFIILTALSITNQLEPLIRMASATLFTVAFLIHIAIKKGEKKDDRNYGKIY